MIFNYIPIDVGVWGYLEPGNPVTYMDYEGGKITYDYVGNRLWLITKEGKKIIKVKKYRWWFFRRVERYCVVNSHMAFMNMQLLGRYKNGRRNKQISSGRPNHSPMF
jgi:hypothetical protein